MPITCFVNTSRTSESTLSVAVEFDDAQPGAPDAPLLLGGNGHLDAHHAEGGVEGSLGRGALGGREDHISRLAAVLELQGQTSDDLSG